jgi:hypothetical protein
MAIDLQGASNAMTQQAQQNSLEQAKVDMENKKQEEALKSFKTALQNL